VVWEDHHWGFGADWDIYARRVSAGGVSLGTAFGVSYDGTNHRLNRTSPSLPMSSTRRRLPEAIPGEGNPCGADVDCSGTVDQADLPKLIGHLFGGTPLGPCTE
jgi:hypothetical protein